MNCGNLAASAERQNDWELLQDVGNFIQTYETTSRDGDGLSSFLEVIVGLCGVATRLCKPVPFFPEPHLYSLESVSSSSSLSHVTHSKAGYPLLANLGATQAHQESIRDCNSITTEQPDHTVIPHDYMFTESLSTPSDVDPFGYETFVDYPSTRGFLTSMHEPFENADRAEAPLENIPEARQFPQPNPLAETSYSFGPEFDPVVFQANFDPMNGFFGPG